MFASIGKALFTAGAIVAWVWSALVGVSIFVLGLIILATVCMIFGINFNLVITGIAAVIIITATIGVISHA